MAAYKLERLEEPTWMPPLLSFVVERHGGTVLGSTRAELQKWWVDPFKAEVVLSKGGWRQLYPMSPRLNVGPLADRVAELVLSGMDDTGSSGRRIDLRWEWWSAGSSRTKDPGRPLRHAGADFGQLWWNVWPRGDRSRRALIASG